MSFVSPGFTLVVTYVLTGITVNVLTYLRTRPSILTILFVTTVNGSRRRPRRSCIVSVEHLMMNLSKCRVHSKTFYMKRCADYYMSLVVRIPAFCICKNKNADQLRGKREADQRLCFRYSDSAIPQLPKPEISSL